MLLIPALRMQKQMDFHEFKASLVYTVSSQLASYMVIPFLRNTYIHTYIHIHTFLHTY